MRIFLLPFLLLLATPAVAQTASALAAFAGLAPVASLPPAALRANLAVTAATERDASAADRARALRDARITARTLDNVADALGPRLAAAWSGRVAAGGSLPPVVAALVAGTLAVTAADAQAAKFFFGNETTDGHGPVSQAAAAILAVRGADPDPLGRAYGIHPGDPGADPFGDPRPFQVVRPFPTWSATDGTGHPISNMSVLVGPAADLRASPSYPSGHTTYGTAATLLLALLVPERYEALVARGASYGHSRVVLGAHWSVDVVAGRTLALFDLAHLLAGDPRYVGQERRGAAPIDDFPALLARARTVARARLSAGCGDTVARCAAGVDDPGADPAAARAALDGGLPIVHSSVAGRTEDVSTHAPQAGLLLTAAFPALTLAAADRILTVTEGPGGGFLDDGSSFGLYSRLDLAAAARLARRVTAPPTPRSRQP